MDIDFHMPSVNIYIQCAIRVTLAKHPITIGGHAQLFDFFLEGVNLFLGFLQSAHKFFVLFFSLRQLLQRLVILAFQRLVVRNRFLQVPHQTLRIVLDESDSLLQVFNFYIVLSEFALK